MKVIYCGDLWEGSTSGMRMEALRALGHIVVAIDTTYTPHGARGQMVRAAQRLGYALDPTGLNRLLLEAVARHRPDLVWIDKCLCLTASTLEAARRMQQGVRLIHYSPDDILASHNCCVQSIRSVPAYDVHVTTKSFNVEELRQLGAGSVLLLHNAYSTLVHRPMAVGPEERKALGGAVGFIGAFERERAETVLFLARHGIPVRVWGGWGKGWGRWSASHREPNLHVELRALWGMEYAKAICSFNINLGLLNRWHRRWRLGNGEIIHDLQTTRSVEIPACGGFLVAERTSEHEALFHDGVEAEFYSSREELLAKCRYYLERPDERAAIARAGRARCEASDYSYTAHVGAALSALFQNDGSPISIRTAV